MDKPFQTSFYESIKEELWQATVPPGLKLIVLPKQGFKKKYATFTTHFGSIDSKFYMEGQDRIVEVPDGVAHFLEHKMFESKEGDVFAKFARLGASPNAYTEFAITSYLFSATDNFYQALDVLLDFVQAPYFTEENVDKEKGIIAQEIRMYQDDPAWRLLFDLLKALYRQHPVKIDIAGTVESIDRITPEILYKCYHTFYHPSNMVVFVAGDIDPKRVLEHVAASLDRRDYSAQGEIKRYYPKEEAGINKKEIKVKLDVSQPMFNLGFKEKNPLAKGLLRRDVTTNLLLQILFGPGSTLFNDLYEEGLIDEDFEASYTAYLNFAYSSINGKTKDPEALHERLLDAVKRACSQGINREDFERTRRKVQGDYLQHFNSLEFITNNYVAYYFKGSDFFNYLNQLRDISLEEVEKRLHEHLDPDFSAFSIVLPG